MSFKEASFCGRLCNIILGVILIACASTAVNSVWYSVWFWNCAGVEDQYVSLLLKEACFATTKPSGNADIGTCTDWTSSVFTNDDPYINQDSADAFTTASGLISAALAFATLFTLLSVGIQLAPQALNEKLRYASI